MFDIKSDFPESFYLSSAHNLDNYLKRIDLGAYRAARSFVYIACMVRDCEKVLPYTLARLKRLGSLFRSARFCIVENDSKDNTKNILEKWHHVSPERRILKCSDLQHKRCEQDYSLDRRKKMALYRNQYMDDAEFQRSDYTIIYDGDISGGLSYHGVLNSLGYDDWNMMGSNSIIYKTNQNNDLSRLHFDIWAYRELGDSEGPYYTQEKANRLNLLRWERGEPPFPVASCFGGLGIYRSADLVGLQYDSYDIDHKTINDKIIANGGTIMVNPSQITLYNSTYFMKENDG